MKPIKDQKILITGATDGIGKLTALKFAEQNAHLIFHGRNKEKLDKVINDIKASTGNENIEGMTADFSSLDEVRNLSDEFLKKHTSLDVLINNAGSGFADERKSKDGYELRFAVNFLAPFLLTHLLLPALKKAAPSRIVNVSSAGQYPINFDDIMLEKNFDAVNAYRQSKLALIMFTIDLAEKLKDDNITANSLHPGTYLDTKMVRESNITPMGKPEIGADAEFYLAESEELNRVTGKYFNVKREAKADSQAYNITARQKLWNIGLELTGLK